MNSIDYYMMQTRLMNNFERQGSQQVRKAAAGYSSYDYTYSIGNIQSERIRSHTRVKEIDDDLLTGVPPGHLNGLRASGNMHWHIMASNMQVSKIVYLLGSISILRLQPVMFTVLHETAGIQYRVPRFFDTNRVSGSDCVSHQQPSFSSSSTKCSS